MSTNKRLHIERVKHAGGSSPSLSLMHVVSIEASGIENLSEHTDTRDITITMADGSKFHLELYARADGDT